MNTRSSNQGSKVRYGCSAIFRMIAREVKICAQLSGVACVTDKTCFDDMDVVSVPRGHNSSNCTQPA